MRRVLLLLYVVIALIVSQPGAAVELSKSMPVLNKRILTGQEVYPNIPFVPPNLSQSITAIGQTLYEFQTNGSSGDRIILHADGSIHICWMNLLGWPYPPSPRYIYYTWVDPMGYYTDPWQVNQRNPGGFCQMAERPNNLVAIGFHETPDQNPLHVAFAIEEYPAGMGNFESSNPPDVLYPQNDDNPGILYWPYCTVDRNGNIHVVSTESTDLTPQRMAYTRSTDDGATWAELYEIDTVTVTSSVLDASPVSDRVVLAYCKPCDLESQARNDVVYYLSENGTSWNWRYGLTNVTNYEYDNDTLWAYTDIDVIIDYNDVIHLVWNASRMDSDNYMDWKTYLYHYDTNTDEITEITSHPEEMFAEICGAWNRPICKMSLACSEEFHDFLAVSWTQFDTSDIAANGYGNGDIWVGLSDDGGANWTISNLTDSHTPGCLSGDCLSENWGCLADDASDASIEGLHLTYIIDKDAGAFINDEGVATMNDVAYHGDAISSVPKTENVPKAISLKGNYPNPFNAKTTISFELPERNQVKLNIYNITGAKVTSLINRELEAGHHEIVWDAGNYASGVYFYNLETEEYTQTKQAVLIK